MILLIAALLIGALIVALVTKKVTLAQVQAEIVKLEGEAKAEEQAIVAKVKAIIASL